MKKWFVACGVAVLAAVSPLLSAAGRPRAREIGVPFEGTPGPLNAITDVAGVTVGHSTIIRGDGKLKVGEGPVRTGVTAIVPRGKARTTTPCSRAPST
jgi:L-aminopeptidase/D-esterase-like protein